jgi:chromosome segregation ATPase
LLQAQADREIQKLEQDLLSSQEELSKMRAQVARARFLEDELKDEASKQNQHDLQTLKSQVLALKTIATKDADTIAELRQQLADKGTALHSKEEAVKVMERQIRALKEEIDRLKVQVDVKVCSSVLIASTYFDFLKFVYQSIAMDDGN